MNKKGFTLIELLIVVAIIGILAAVGAAVIPGLLENSKIKTMQTIHANVVRVIRIEMTKCLMGDSYFMVSIDKKGNNHQQACASGESPWQTTLWLEYII